MEAGMNFNNIYPVEGIDFGEMFSGQYLLGLISAFDNRFQAKADKFFEEISWKQFFAIICINLCKESPTIGELSEVMGSSHQNVKRILDVLVKKDFVKILADENDGRKQRIYLTEKTREFCESHEEESEQMISNLFKGISEEDLMITIKTIIEMERNVRNI